MFRKSCEKELYAPFRRDASKWFHITEPSQLNGDLGLCLGCAMGGSIAQRNGNAIGSCLRCCSEDTGTLSGDFAASSTDSACPDAPSCRSGKISAAAFDTKPLPPYNAPLVRANSASAIILLWAFCPHPTHSARRRFRRALMRLALFSVSNGVLGVLPCRPRRPAARACACATED